LNHPAILEEGRNCWRKRRADRAAFLIDGAAYFEAFADAVERAQRSILIVGWDIDSRTPLFPGRNDTEPLPVLGDLLNQVVAKKKGLRARVLVWDFALMFAMEREPQLLFKTGWKRHRRVHFHMDGEHPLGASQHQKIVVVDDKIAFAGGLDLTKARWDTSEHRPSDPRRKDPQGVPYGPFHDVQMLVDGEAARSLGELARERWHRATGKRIRPPNPGEGDPWPAGVRPDLESVDVAIARTEPEYKGRKAVREVEQLYQDSIEAARKWIYIENQYLTSKAIQESLASRLRHREGPEVVIVLPRHCTGWLQQNIMGSLRGLVLQRLREADAYGRLGVYFPRTSPSHAGEVMVHAKVMIADEGLARVGSANLSNRSMGLDSECDLAVESGGDRSVERAVASFRNRLLSEHLDVSREELARAIDSQGSLLRAVEALRGKTDRSLVPLEQDPSEWVEALSAGSDLLDPEQPMEIDHLIDEFVREEKPRKGWGRIKLGILFCLLAGLALLWRYTPLGDLLNVETLTTLAQRIADGPMPAVYVLLAFVAGSLVVLPVTVLIASTAAVFDPVPAFAYALAGSVISGSVNYVAGSVLGRDFVRRIAGRRLNRLSRRLATRGFVAVFLVRMLPVAPFTAVNIVAGASHIRFRDFILGTTAGMAPGIFAVTLLTDRVKEVMRKPDWTSLLSLAVVLLFLAAGSWFLSKRLRRKVPKETDADRSGLE
jgi:phosphatidylserine/phosphatidylglycerophosphate/cardiolipin synthase-like enzyme/uncharacterized membrane protein YdjX (TVP38/TMEM64 family)